MAAALIRIYAPLITAALVVSPQLVFAAARRRLDPSPDADDKALPPPSTYRVSSLREFRQSWKQALEAETDAEFEIPTGSRFSLRAPLVCSKAIRMTVFSNGATLDGMRKSQIFKVKGCSLTLRGLSLVNGYAPAGLKQECRDRDGAWSPFFGNKQFKPNCVDSVRLARYFSPIQAYC